MLKRIKKIFYRCYENTEITYEVLKNMMKNNSVILIDVRSNQEYKEGHLEGAINVPLYNLKNDISKYVSNKEDVLILYCSSGYRSKKAEDLLKKIGYVNIYTLKNGMEKYVL